MGNKINIIGKKFNKWTVISEDPIRGNSKEIRYLCKCDCGNITITDGKSIRQGRSKQCMVCRSKDTSELQLVWSIEKMRSQKWGKRTVLEEVRDRNGKIKYKCICDCGKISTIYGGHLRSGIGQMCGNCAGNDTHGLSKHPLYKIWTGMRQRCENPKNSHYHNYGSVGVKVCERWQNFENFYEDMGERPKGYQLDRIDVSGDYEPSNCKWSTPKENMNNRRISLVNRDKYIMVKKDKLCSSCLQNLINSSTT